MNNNITAMIFTFNEERRLPLVFENLKNFCQLIVFDGGSTDGTEDFCKRNKIKFVSRPKESTMDTRVRGIHWSIENSPTEYVLHVHCGHFYPKELLSRFSQVANENKLTAVYEDVVIYRYGKAVHRTLVRRIASACTFYKKEAVNIGKSKIHDELAITFDKEKMIRLEGKDELSIHLFQDEDCQSFTVKTLKYAEIEASQKFKAGQRVTMSDLFIKPLSRFFYRYFRVGSFALGEAGLVYAVLNLIYDFHVNILLWELIHNLRLQEAYRLNAMKREQMIKDQYS